MGIFGGRHTTSGVPMWIGIVGWQSSSSLTTCGLTLWHYRKEPTFPNVTSAATLTFSEWPMYYYPHPGGNVNGVAPLVKNTLDPFVKRGPDKTPDLFQDTQGTRLGVIVHLPNRKPLRVLNCYGRTCRMENASKTRTSARMAMMYSRGITTMLYGATTPPGFSMASCTPAVCTTPTTNSTRKPRERMPIGGDTTDWMLYCCPQLHGKASTL